MALAAFSFYHASVKTTPELFRPAFWVLQRTGDVESVDPDKPSWGQPRTICARSILAWRQQGGAQWTDRHGDYSWRWLRLLDTLHRERETSHDALVVPLSVHHLRCCFQPYHIHRVLLSSTFWASLKISFLLTTVTWANFWYMSSSFSICLSLWNAHKQPVANTFTFFTVPLSHHTHVSTRYIRD